jgi:tripartite-type tricarboxylate transporter receptor subunit TctC
MAQKATRAARRSWSGALVAVLLLPSLAVAQSPVDFFRGKTINISVGFSAGGGYDLHARVLARHFGRHVAGEPAVVVKNVPGAGGLGLVNSFYSNAVKDGTELATFDRGIPLDPLLYGTNSRFDPLKLVWIGSADNDASTCLSWHSSPIKTIDDLMKQELIVGGTGSTANSVVFPRALNAVLGTKFKVIAGYPGSAEVLIGMERAEVHGFCGFGFATLESLRPDWVRDRKVNQLVQLAVQKNPDHPEVPLALDLAKTEADRQAIRLMVSPNLFARPFAAPPGLPAERLELLRKAFDATVTDPEYRADAAARGLHVELVTGPEIERLLRQLYDTPKDVVERMKEAMK